METVNINTSQNVQISYSIAGLGERILAYLIDSLIIASITIVIVLVFVFSGTLDSSPYMIILATIPTFFYHLFFEITMDGQSIGKKMMGIKVVKMNGSQATLGAYLLRWIVRPIDIFLYGGIAILCISIGGKGQRLGDMAAGTTVIKLQKSVFLKDHTLSTLDENYKPVFLDADQLEPEYIELINKAIKAKLEMLDDKPVKAMATKIKAKLEIDTNLPDLKFLHTVIKDYHHLKLMES